jgi:hypothetical protein
MKRSTNLASFSLLATLALPLLGACSSGGGGGGGVPVTVLAETEPNDSTAEADTLAVGRTGQGAVLDSTDADFWSVALTAGQFVTIEVFGNRFDFDGWTTGGTAPRVRVFDTDETTLLLEQSEELLAWSDDQDTDILSFRAPANGTYFVAVDVADAAASGGDYLVSVKPTSVAAPLQFEIEPAGATGANDVSTTAEAIVPGTIHGFHVDDESDFFSFNVTAPSLVTFTMHTHRNGAWLGDVDYFDSVLQLWSPTLAVLDSNDDTYYLDSALHYLIATPGTYFLEVLECCGTGNAGYFVEFTLDEVSDLAPLADVEPNDDVLTAQTAQFGQLIQGTVDSANDDLYAFACNAGDRIQMQIFDLGNSEGATAGISCTIEDSAANAASAAFGSNLRTYRTILTDSGTFYVRVTTASATSYGLRVTQTPATFEVEPNDDMVTAGTFDASGSAAGSISVLDDPDTFSFSATAGVPVHFQCLADASGPNGFFELDDFGSVMSPALTVFDSTVTTLTSAFTSPATSVGIVDGLATLSLTFVPPATGTYYVQVTDENSGFGTDSYYVLLKR